MSALNSDTFLKTLSKVKQKLIRLRAYCKLGLLGLQAKPWCCGLCRGWKEDWNSSNYRVKPIFGQSISYKTRLTPKKILARIFFNGSFFGASANVFYNVFFSSTKTAPKGSFLTSHCIVRKATRIEKGKTGHKVSFSVRLFLRFPDIVSCKFEVIHKPPLYKSCEMMIWKNPSDKLVLDFISFFWCLVKLQFLDIQCLCLECSSPHIFSSPQKKSHPSRFTSKTESQWHHGERRPMDCDTSYSKLR